MSTSHEGYPVRDAPERIVSERSTWVYRHPLLIRICHWINAVCLLILLMSGLQIFNAHPALYAGQASDFTHPLLWIHASTNPPREGITQIGSHTFTTTGVLGLSKGSSGQETERAFPSWATLPSYQDLATGRHWHFLFAWLLVINGAIYLIYGILTRQLVHRLVPTGDQVRDVGTTLRQHLTLRFPRGTEAKRYNLLQKLTYLVVVGVLLPMQILTGLAMSPAMDTAWPFLLTLFGGRQSARTIHFLIMNALVLFVLVHVAMVIASGFWNNMRAMMSGWYVIARQRLRSDQDG